MSSSATGGGMTICFLGAILLILTQKSSQKFGDVLGIFYDKEASRKVQILQLAESYATELEKRVRQFPTQWYNFYDFWS